MAKKKQSECKKSIPEKIPAPKKTVATNTNQADSKDMSAAGHNFSPDERKLKELASMVRTKSVADVIWNTCFSDAERRKITGDKSIGSDIVERWVKFKAVSPTKAVLVMACEVDLITEQGLDRLLRSFGEDVTSEKLLRPEWSKAQGVGELRLEGTTIRRVGRLKMAKNVVHILDVFQVRDWPRSIENPLPKQDSQDKSEQQIQETVKSLNKGLDIIWFRSTDHGRIISWERKPDR